MKAEIIEEISHCIALDKNSLLDKIIESLLKEKRGSCLTDWKYSLGIRFLQQRN